MFETSKHVPKTEKRCCVFENNSDKHSEDYENRKKLEEWSTCHFLPKKKTTTR